MNTDKTEMDRSENDTVARWLMIQQHRLLPICVYLCSSVLICVLCLSAPAQAPPKVAIKDGKALMDPRVLPVPPTPRAEAKHSGGFRFGIKVGNERITFGEQRASGGTAAAMARTPSPAFFRRS